MSLSVASQLQASGRGASRAGQWHPCALGAWPLSPESTLGSRIGAQALWWWW
jgi:hypothetical protein